MLSPNPTRIPGRPPTLHRGLGATLLLALVPLGPLAGQTPSPPPPPKTFYACYVPLVGTVYRIKEAGLPDHCFGPTSGTLMHIQFSWTDGLGALLNGDAAGGDLTGTYPTPGVGKLLGIALGTTAPTNGQVLGFNGTSWVATTPSAGVTVHSQLTGLLNDDHPQYLLTNGTRALTGPMSMGGFRLTGLANGTTNGDAVPFQQAVKSGDAAGGDLAGTYPNPGVTRLAGVPLASTAPTSGQVLTFNGTGWAPAAASAASLPNVGCGGCSATGVSATALGGASATGAYAVAAGQLVTASGLDSFAAGTQTTASGASAIALGDGAFATGASSLALGSTVSATANFSFAMGDNTTATAGDAVAIGSAAVASGPSSMALGHSASTNGHTGAFVYGDASVNPFLLQVFQAVADNEFAVRATGGFRFRTAGDLSTGCDLPAGSGVFSCTSSRDLKTDFIPVDDDALLNGIASVPVTTWRYRTEAQPIRHLGPMAQDFRAAFGLGTNETSIGLLDLSGVTFAGVQALEKRTDALARENAALRGENDLLRTRMTDVERRLSALEAAARK